MHASIATPWLAANYHTENGQDHLHIMERPGTHISSLPHEQVCIHFHV